MAVSLQVSDVMWWCVIKSTLDVQASCNRRWLETRRWRHRSMITCMTGLTAQCHDIMHCRHVSKITIQASAPARNE